MLLVLMSGTAAALLILALRLDQLVVWKNIRLADLLGSSQTCCCHGYAVQEHHSCSFHWDRTRSHPQLCLSHAKWALHMMHMHVTAPSSYRIHGEVFVVV